MAQKTSKKNEHGKSDSFFIAFCRTALRWNETWQEQGLVQQIKYGTYNKNA